MDTSPPDRAAQAIEQWSRERPDLDSLPMELLGRFGEVTQLIARDHIHPLFARFGLQAGEFDVLATLRRSGAPYALTPTALYKALMISSGGMTSRLDRLARDGLIERQAHPDDRRAVQVGLTANGFRLVESMMIPHVDNQRRVLATLNIDEQRELNRLLAKLLAGLPGTGHASTQAREALTEIAQHNEQGTVTSATTDKPGKARRSKRTA